MRSVATSTVAMTIYNALAAGSGSRLFDEIASAVSSWAAESRLVVTESQMHEAVDELMRRGRLYVRIAGYDVTDPLRRVVVKRDRRGDGWHGWQVYARPVAAPGMVFLEDVVR